MAALPSPTPPSTTSESASPSSPLPPPPPLFFPSPLQSPEFSFSTSIPSSSTTPPTSLSLASSASSRSVHHRRDSKSKRRTEKLKSPECGELAGRTTAECVAILCCCPLCIIDFAILTTFKLPAGLCRKVLWKRRLSRRTSSKSKPNMKKKKNVRNENEDHEDNINNDAGDDDNGDDDFLCFEFSEPPIVHQVTDTSAAVVSSVWPGLPPSEQMKGMDEEMREMFFSTGFFRSMSKKKIIE